MTNWLSMKMGKLAVSYLPELDGGGATFGRQFLPLIEHLVRPVPVAFEWCSGPAFIGFSLLARGLCRKLVLSDANPLAREAVRRTVRRNGLKSTVKFFLKDHLAALPKSKWDLVVANPPHFDQATGNRLADDPSWRSHREFFRQVRARLQPNADVFLQENFMGALPEEIIRLASESRLVLHNVFFVTSPESGNCNVYYFLHFKPDNPRVCLLPNSLEVIRLGLFGGRSPKVPFPANTFCRLEVTNRVRAEIVLNLWGRDRMRLIRTQRLPPGGKILTHPFSLQPGIYSLVDCTNRNKLCTIYAK
jgi:hypothetical protein